MLTLIQVLKANCQTAKENKDFEEFFFWPLHSFALDAKSEKLRSLFFWALHFRASLCRGT